MQRRFVDLATVADILAISIGKAYDLVRSGELAALQIGGRRQWRVEVVALDIYIERQLAMTRDRIDASLVNAQL